MTQTYKQQIDKLSNFLVKNYSDEITGEMDLTPTAVEITIRLLNYGSTADGVLLRLHKKEW